jgi:hypothetical protein
LLVFDAILKELTEGRAAAAPLRREGHAAARFEHFDANFQGGLALFWIVSPKPESIPEKFTVPIMIGRAIAQMRLA